ncbi:LysR substrate-binding domain-containing protein [Arthrobacter sp. UYEF20]|uniref:LysR substrate-binding domain-containing protein n=1 Tax=Arthrobacter sp. UYEF20 TaxID=1756363 RepID=UPI003395CC64
MRVFPSAANTIWRKPIASSHPLASASAVDLADLASEPYIQYEATPGTVNVTDAFTARGLEPRIEARVSQTDLVEALVGRGVGYGLLMSRPNRLPMSTEGRQVVRRPLDPPVTVSHVVGIWPEDMNLTPRASALLDFAVEKLGGYGRADRVSDPTGADGTSAPQPSRTPNPDRPRRREGPSSLHPRKHRVAGPCSGDAAWVRAASSAAGSEVEVAGFGSAAGA